MALVLKPHELRVVHEADALKEKITLLTKFIQEGSPGDKLSTFESLDEIDQDLLTHQVRYMIFYHGVLIKRIERFEFGNEANVTTGANRKN